MKVNVKDRSNGNVFQIEISATDTLGELRSRISSKLENLDNGEVIRISLGAEELKFPDPVLIKDVGIVSGDRLFIETCPPTSTHTAADARQDAPLENEGSDNRQQCASKESDENPNPAIAFRDLVIRAARDYLENSQYSNTFLQSWNGRSLSGAELHFEFHSRNETSIIFIVVTAFSSPCLSAVVNVGRIVDLSRKLLSSFTVQQATVKDCVIDGVAHALSNSGATGVTLIHLCSLRCIREQLLEHMDPRTVTRLSEVNHILRSILMSSSVDRTYWMKRLSSDFGQQMVQKAQTKGVTFRSIYREEYARRKLARQSDALSDHPYATPLPSGTLIRPYDPHPNMPGRTRSPHGPLFPAPDPLQPIPNPMSPLIQPPGVNPFGPGGAPFGGPRGPFGGRNPLDPFDPNNR
ncbi:hypothetical protein Angca_001480, partial [Angiostrongylus cantonensis]